MEVEVVGSCAEICDNNIDDDGDGDIDNCDADCNPDFNVPSAALPSIQQVMKGIPTLAMANV